MSLKFKKNLTAQNLTVFFSVHTSTVSVILSQGHVHTHAHNLPLCHFSATETLSERTEQNEEKTHGMLTCCERSFYPSVQEVK